MQYPLQYDSNLPSLPKSTQFGLCLNFTFMGLPWQSSGQDSALPLQGERVRSQVGELRPRMLHSAAKI